MHTQCSNTDTRLSRHFATVCKCLQTTFSWPPSQLPYPRWLSRIYKCRRYFAMKSTSRLHAWMCLGLALGQLFFLSLAVIETAIKNDHLEKCVSMQGHASLGASRWWFLPDVDVSNRKARKDILLKNFFFTCMEDFGALFMFSNKTISSTTFVQSGNLI